MLDTIADSRYPSTVRMHFDGKAIPIKNVVPTLDRRAGILCRNGDGYLGRGNTYVQINMSIFTLRIVHLLNFNDLAVIRASDNLLSDIRYFAPSSKTFVFLPVFLIASGIQYDCHLYLASLKKYTLPSHPSFLHLVSPHYTAECAIYLSLVFLAAPKGALVNKTILSGLIFVVVNLGISASNTKAWYMRKFGEESVEHRWRMVPYLY